MEATTESIVQRLRDCAAGGVCKGCPYHEHKITNCIDLLMAAAADRLEELEDAQNVLKTGLKAINNRLVYIGAVKANAETSILLPEPPKEG